MSNERITKAAEAGGFCCPYSMLKTMSGPKDTHMRVAIRVGLGYQTIRNNRRKLAAGVLKCTNQENCRLKLCEGETDGNDDL